MKDDSPELKQGDKNHIVIECSLCSERGLHVIGTKASEETRQCLNCGFVTAPKFKCDEDKISLNPNWDGLTKEMQGWSKWSDGFIWIPTIMTLPFGMLYPLDKDGTMYWSFAELEIIPEDERKNFPREDGNGNYDQKFNTDNAKTYDSFIECLAYVNNKAKFNEGIDDTKQIITELETDK